MEIHRSTGYSGDGFRRGGRIASVYDLKPRFQALLRPSIRALAAAGVTANMVTVAAVLGSVGIGAALVLWKERAVLLLIPAWLFARMALNAIDGMMARELAMKSNLGAVLNEVGDVVSDLALYLPFAAGPLRWPAIAFAVGAVLTEFCGVLGQALSGTREYQGPMGKSDRALVVGALAFFTFFFPALDAAWPWVLWIGAALAGITCVNRSRAALRKVGR